MATIPKPPIPVSFHPFGFSFRHVGCPVSGCNGHVFSGRIYTDSRVIVACDSCEWSQIAVRDETPKGWHEFDLSANHAKAEKYGSCEAVFGHNERAAKGGPKVSFAQILSEVAEATGVSTEDILTSHHQLHLWSRGEVAKRFHESGASWGDVAEAFGQRRSKATTFKTAACRAAKKASKA